MIQDMLKNLLTNNKAEPNTKTTDEKLPSNLTESVDLFKKLYHVPLNSDIKTHEVTINGLNKKACLFFIDTITDTLIIEQSIIQPLLANTDESLTIDSIIQTKTIEITDLQNDCMQAINRGDTVLFIENSNKAYILSTIKYEHRSIEAADNEITLLGPKESFTESLDLNINLIRKSCKNQDLIFENADISNRMHNQISIAYFNDLANEEILSTLKKRLDKIDTAALITISLLRQYIEDHKYSVFPTILQTERPDRIISFLNKGHIAILMENSPTALVLPISFWSLLNNPDDRYFRPLFGNFNRIIRLIALFITLFISAGYIAVTGFHAEMVPPDLLLAIASTREKVPFPAFFEVLVMELSFELIREAGLRVPAPIGPTIGIVGALILGQAASEANMVSPIVIIVVALSGVSSFVIGDIGLNFSVRILRLLFIGVAAVFGIYGMVLFFACLIYYMVSMKSFGVHYLSPVTPAFSGSQGQIFRHKLNKEKLRPNHVNPKDKVQEGDTNA